MNYYSLVTSNNIAIENNQTFSNFNKSSYADGSYFEKYTKQNFIFKNKKVADIFKNIYLPTIDDWKNYEIAL